MSKQPPRKAPTVVHPPTTNQCFPITSNDGKAAVWPLPAKAQSVMNADKLFPPDKLLTKSAINKVKAVCSSDVVVNRSSLYHCTIDPQGMKSGASGPGQKSGAAIAVSCNTKASDPPSKKVPFICARAQDTSTKCTKPPCADKSAPLICVKDKSIKTTDTCAPQKIGKDIVWPLKSVPNSVKNSGGLYPGSKTILNGNQVISLCQSGPNKADTFLTLKDNLKNCEVVNADKGIYKCTHPMLDSKGQKIPFVCAQPYTNTCPSGASKPCIDKSAKKTICFLNNKKTTLEVVRKNELVTAADLEKLSEPLKAQVVETAQQSIAQEQASKTTVDEARAASLATLATALQEAERRAALEYGQGTELNTTKRAARVNAVAVTPLTHGIFKPTACTVQGVTITPSVMDKNDNTGMQLFKTPETLNSNICFFPRNPSTEKLCYGKNDTFGCHINFNEMSFDGTAATTLPSAEDVRGFVSNKAANSIVGFENASGAPMKYNEGLLPNGDQATKYDISAVRRCMALAIKTGGDTCANDAGYYGTRMQQCVASIKDPDGNPCSEDDVRLKTTAPAFKGDTVLCQPTVWDGKDFNSQYAEKILYVDDPLIPNLFLTKANQMRGSVALTGGTKCPNNEARALVVAREQNSGGRGDTVWPENSDQFKLMFDTALANPFNMYKDTKTDYDIIRLNAFKGDASFDDKLPTAAEVDAIKNLTPAAIAAAAQTAANAAMTTTKLTETNVCTQQGVKLYGYLQNPNDPMKCTYVPPENNLIRSFDSTRIATGGCRGDGNFTGLTKQEVKNWARNTCNVRTSEDCERKEITIYGLKATADPNVCVYDSTQGKDYSRNICTGTGANFGTGYNTVEEIMSWAQLCNLRTSIDCLQGPDTAPDQMLTIGGYRLGVNKPLKHATCERINVPFAAASTAHPVGALPNFDQTLTRQQYIDWARNSKVPIRDNANIYSQLVTPKPMLVSECPGTVCNDSEFAPGSICSVAGEKWKCKNQTWVACPNVGLGPDCNFV